MIACKSTICSVALLGVLVACGTDTPQVNPAPVFDPGMAGTGGGSGGSGGATNAGGASGTAGEGGTAGVSGASGAGASPPVRRVIVRDPFEGYDDADNLMLDGGFELSGETAGTWGAYAGTMNFGNGAVCRTGLRCGLTRPDDPIYGFFVSPASGSLEVSFRAQTGGAPCDSVAVVVADAYGQGSASPVSVTSATKAADGWCDVRGTSPVRAYGTPLIMFEPSQGKTYIDDVVVRPGMSTTAPSPPAAWKGRMRDRLELVRARARATLRNDPGVRRSIRAGAPWSAAFDPWIR